MKPETTKTGITKAMEEQGKNDGAFGDALGAFTVDRLNHRLERMKGIIDSNDFRECKATRMKDAWEALIEVVEILAAGLINVMRRQSAIAAQRPVTPKTVQDRLWAIAEKSPMAAAMIFLGVVALKLFGHNLTP